MHYDRGTQYNSGAYQALLTKLGLVGIMSCKGICEENSVMERVWQKDYVNHSDAIHGVLN